MSNRIKNDNLTARELEVLQYVAQGKTNKEIAKILAITDHTVKAHIASILSKNGVQYRLQDTTAAVV